MNGKQYVGRNASTFESYKPNSPVTGVRLLVDDENEYVAGDTEGNVWELTCPYGTQEMANNILASLSGKIYKGFEADNAVLTPSAELGDGVTVNGLYTMLAYRKVEFGPGHMSTIAAPGDNEPDEEYKYTPQKDREVNRKLAQTRSLITKSAEEIRLAIEAADGRISELKVTLDGVTVTDESGTTRIKGSSIETGSIAAGAIKAEQIQLSGAITWSDLASEVQGTIYDQHTDLPGYIHSNYISSTEIRSPSIKTNLLTVTVPDGTSGISGLSLQGYIIGNPYEMFRISCSDTFVTINSPANGTIRYTSRVDFEGIVDFSDATVRNLTAVFG